MKISSFVAGILCLALSLSLHAQPNVLKSPGELYAKMTPSERIGQLFIWTYPGAAFTPAVESWLSRYQPGALIVFSRNIKSQAQIAKYNSDLQKFAARRMKAPFFLMIDQEGGTVARLHTRIPLPSALALGQIDDLKFITGYGQALAAMIKSFGFNFNLAPVLDISNPNKDTFIGSRAFGNDPLLVSERAGAFAEGLSQGGIIPTAKHFPGHGGIMQDSHQTTPKKLATYADLADRDLVPFEGYAQAGYPRAVMMAHMALPNIDPSGLPSTYSPVLIQESLRGKLGYDGLIVTDDLEMSGAAEFDIGERAVRAFLAGNDMLMFAGPLSHQRQAFKALLSAVRTGRIGEARLRTSVERILNYKQKLSTFTYSEARSQEAIRRVQDLARRILQKNFHLAVKGKTWPELEAGAHVLVLSADPRFYDSFQKIFRGQARFYHLTPQSLPRVEREINSANYDVLIYYASGQRTARWLNQLSSENHGKTIVINANNPAEVEAQDSFLTVLNINSHFPQCGGELADSLNTTNLREPAQEEAP